MHSHFRVGQQLEGLFIYSTPRTEMGPSHLQTFFFFPLGIFPLTDGATTSFRRPRAAIFPHTTIFDRPPLVAEHTDLIYTDQQREQRPRESSIAAGIYFFTMAGNQHYIVTSITAGLPLC
ncbi:hypothetical protein QN277_008603 [Acacia crassicarpa]|uniref:Uncharacterized protein n=1 Tax=Acacia crassicarpa TaxID=499986 RepID=A0AAE1MD90_9FABA|nr:hypothetical protein QN277_008603 [Acacia crassicarpa]